MAPRQELPRRKAAHVDREQRVRPRGGGRPASSDCKARSSTSPSRCTSAPGSTSATPTSSCAARSPCRTGSARTSRSPCSPRATRRARPRRPAPTSSAREDLAKRVAGGLHRLRRRDRHAGHDAGRRPARPRARARRARCPTRRSARSPWTSRKAVEESKSGKVEYRTDRTAIVHLVIGKASFEERALLENYAAVDRGDRPREALGRPRAGTSGRSPWRRRWARASRSTPSRTRDIVAARTARRHAGGGRDRGIDCQPRDARDPRRCTSTASPGQAELIDASRVLRLPRRPPPCGRSPREGTREDAMNKEQKAAVVDEIAGQIKESHGGLRRGLPRDLRAPGGGAARDAARGRRDASGSSRTR